MNVTALPSRLTTGEDLLEEPVVSCHVVAGLPAGVGGRQRNSWVAPAPLPAEVLPAGARFASERKATAPPSAIDGLLLPLAALRSPGGSIGVSAQRDHGLVGPEAVESKKSTLT